MYFYVCKYKVCILNEVGCNIVEFIYFDFEVCFIKIVFYFCVVWIGFYCFFGLGYLKSYFMN